mgnify:CR=1 FL=1
MQNNSIWIYPWDLMDEGVSSVLDRLQNVGINGINVAAYYHSGRFFLPHNPKRKVYFTEPGALYFEPDQSWYRKSSIKPPVSKFASNSFWDELRNETKKRSMTLTVWMLSLHNSQIGFNYPETNVVNAFGDKSPVALCASNPDVQELMLSVIDDITKNLDVDKVLIESLEYMPFRHDYHHEVIGIPLKPAIEFLMSLSFNETLVKDAKERGIDIESVRNYVKQVCEEHFMNPYKPEDLSIEKLSNAIDGEFSKYLKLREDYLTDMFKKIHEVIKGNNANIKIGLVDFSPILPLGVNDGFWENGVNLKECSEFLDELHPTFYFTDREIMDKRVKEYLALIEKLNNEIDIIPAVRAILPQVSSKQDLEATVNSLNDLSDGYSFYNYGFMTYQTLDWIREVIKEQK